MSVKGAIIGDIVGSVYEWNNLKSKDFPLFREDCFFTDDTVMSVAVAEALLDSLNLPSRVRAQRLTESMQTWGSDYPGRDYGGHFEQWIHDPNPAPYNSWGNGAPMRCSAAGMLAVGEPDAMDLGKQTAYPTHNHYEGVKAAELTARLIWLAQNKEAIHISLDALRTLAEVHYKIPVLNEIRPSYKFDVSSQGTMPVALAAFLESTGFEDAIRNAISVGGDSDTIAAITGSIAGAFYGVPDELWDKAKTYLDSRIISVVDRLYKIVPTRLLKTAD